ncbi:hypothetical protein C2845_PM05G27040 [Panicum miliaceum]|uniref:Uncharacterized protein n=1 Tax=Panicum miliaceum TaxID=4540 RepID=A0A3L6SZD8_PANMI|nr:hypothetical protein C2845_PM05G27040 [Panicum miliaceum]
MFQIWSVKSGVVQLGAVYLLVREFHSEIKEIWSSTLLLQNHTAILRKHIRMKIMPRRMKMDIGGSAPNVSSCMASQLKAPRANPDAEVPIDVLQQTPSIFEDDGESDDDVDVSMVQDNADVPDVNDPFGKVYENVPSETHMLEPVDNFEHCNAKKFQFEPPGFCCRSGKIHLSTPETPSELMRLWSCSDADARHLRANILFFNGHFSFTSLYCHFDSQTTNVRNGGVYTFRSHGQIYHNVRSFGKEDGTEPRHLELYFYDDDLSLEHRYRRFHEECLRKRWDTSGQPLLQTSKEDGSC